MATQVYHAVHPSLTRSTGAETFAKPCNHFYDIFKRVSFKLREILLISAYILLPEVMRRRDGWETPLLREEWGRSPMLDS
ncbi:MAG: hypothetical protein WAO19_13955 [Candidatus Kryptoniota bacterium]